VLAQPVHADALGTVGSKQGSVIYARAHEQPVDDASEDENDPTKVVTQEF